MIEYCKVALLYLTMKVFLSSHIKTNTNTKRYLKIHLNFRKGDLLWGIKKEKNKAIRKKNQQKKNQMENYC